MADVAQLVETAAARTVAKLAAERDAAQAVAKRRLPIWLLSHQHGLSDVAIERLLVAELLTHGWSVEQIRGSGVSHDSIRRIAAAPRPAS